jgi:hypothetical protein
LRFGNEKAVAYKNFLAKKIRAVPHILENALILIKTGS